MAHKFINAIAHSYMIAKEAVINAGYAWEIDWQGSVDFCRINESDFLREAAWVTLSAGFRESVVRAKFPYISDAFLGWQSAKRIAQQHRTCRKRALLFFGCKRKIDAIVATGKRVAELGFAAVKTELIVRPLEFIRTFPFMGPATSFHLAKNLGLQVVKPDRHLIRVALATGHSTPHALCEAIARVVGDEVSVVDLVIWRYATLDSQYLRLFAA